MYLNRRESRDARLETRLGLNESFYIKTDSLILG